MKFVALFFLGLVLVARIAHAEELDSSASAFRSRTSVEGLFGVHTSAGGLGIGLGYSLSDRLSVGIRWFAGNMDETKTYDNFDNTRISFISADGHSEDFAVFAKYLVWDTLTISSAIGQRKYSGLLDIHDKQNFLRNGEVRTNSTMTEAYLGIGNYWTGSWYKIGADWIGFSVPLGAKVDAAYYYTEPTESGVKFNETNPVYYYSSVDALLKRSKTIATQTSYTFLLGNVTIFL